MNPTAKSTGRTVAFVQAGKKIGRFPESAVWLPSQPGRAALACTLVPPSACKREKQKAQEVTLKIASILFFLKIQTLLARYLLMLGGIGKSCVSVRNTRVLGTEAARLLPARFVY